MNPDWNALAETTPADRARLAVERAREAVAALEESNAKLQATAEEGERLLDRVRGLLKQARER